MSDDKVVNSWGVVNAAECEVLDSKPGLNRLRLKNGMIYSWLNMPARDKAGILIGELHASGFGKVSLRTSTCLRPPGCKEKTFLHSIRKEIGPFELTPERSVFHFIVPMDAYEQGYIYISVAGEATVSHVSGVFEEK